MLYQIEMPVDYVEAFAALKRAVEKGRFERKDGIVFLGFKPH